MALDMTDTIQPRSDQMNADDLLSGPRTFTIAEVRKNNNAEQPVDVVLAEFPSGRPFKPSKSMRRIMVAAWGADASTYAGKRLTLYRDPSVRFGGQDVGGIRISHMSHLTRRLTLALTVTRGKRSPYVVEPLPDDVPASAPVDEGTVARLAELRAEWAAAEPGRRKAIESEVAALSAATAQPAPTEPASVPPATDDNDWPPTPEIPDGSDG